MLDFTSERKRMSVIIESDTGKTYLLCKGADSVILERSIQGKELVEQDIQVQFSPYFQSNQYTGLCRYWIENSMYCLERTTF